jgi:hypothetical protein
MSKLLAVGCLPLVPPVVWGVRHLEIWGNRLAGFPTAVLALSRHPLKWSAGIAKRGAKIGARLKNNPSKLHYFVCACRLSVHEGEILLFFLLLL